MELLALVTNVDFDGEDTVKGSRSWWASFLWLLQAKKLMEHRRRLERKREEKEITAKKERMRKAREAAQKARKVTKSS